MTTLSALDFLGLAEQRRVARVDLAEAGYEGHVFVCDLSAAQRQTILAPKKGTKVVTRKDGSQEVDMSDMPRDAGTKVLMACLVTDAAGGATLERAWDGLEPDEEYFTIAKSQLVLMAEEWRKSLGTESAVRAKLEELSNAVVDLIVTKVGKISGTGEPIEEKKES